MYVLKAWDYAKTFLRSEKLHISYPKADTGTKINIFCIFLHIMHVHAPSMCAVHLIYACILCMYCIHVFYTCILPTVFYACILCMYSMYVLHVCIPCMYSMCAFQMYSIYVFYVCILRVYSNLRVQGRMQFFARSL